MTITTTSGVNAFDRNMYQTLASAAAKYHRENYFGVLEAFPTKICGFNVDSYKKPIFGASEGITGGKPGVNSLSMQTAKSHKVHGLANVNAHLAWDPEDVMKLGPQFVEQKQEQLAEWARQATISMFKGVYSEGYNSSIVGQGELIADGILTNATSVVDLDGTDSTLAAAGDVYKALTKFVKTIPLRYVQGKTINLLMDAEFFSRANGSTFTNASGVTEWEQFLRFYRDGPSPYKIGNVFFSDDLALDASADTVGTHSRLVAWIADPAIVERAYSRGFSMLGETINYAGGVDQMWTVKMGGCVHDATGVLYSEQIAWS